MQRSLIILAALVAISSSVARAQGLESTQEVVSAHRGGFSNPEIAHRLLIRLEQASLDVCGAPSGSDRGYVDTVRRSECFASALKGAVAAAQMPALDQAYADDFRHLAVKST